MPLHFTEDELAGRRQRAIRLMEERGLDGLLMFRQESMYYLTGYDSFDYVHFQCLYFGADGMLTLLTRAPGVRAARGSSIIADIRVWADAPDADPAQDDLRPILEAHGCKGKRLGVEWASYGLTGLNALRVQAALDGFCTLDDASDLVSRLRMVKSEAETEYLRRAAYLADAALAEAVRLARPGAFEGDILAAMQGTVFQGDGDYPGNSFIINSGPRASMSRYQAGRRVLGDDDQLTVEFAGVFRHYHSCLFRTIKVGKPSQRHEDMHTLAVETLLACENALRPGKPIGDVFDAYVNTVTKGGHGDVLYNACGYSLGATFAPTWMDWPMLYRGNPIIAVPGMVFFPHPGVRSTDDLLAQLGETVLVTETGCERLSASPLDYIRNA
jgi:Xaa-Pro dipeptidase